MSWFSRLSSMAIAVWSSVASAWFSGVGLSLRHEDERSEGFVTSISAETLESSALLLLGGWLSEGFGGVPAAAGAAASSPIVCVGESAGPGAATAGGSPSAAPSPKKVVHIAAACSESAFAGGGAIMICLDRARQLIPPCLNTRSLQRFYLKSDWLDPARLGLGYDYGTGYQGTTI